MMDNCFTASSSPVRSFIPLYTFLSKLASGTIQTFGSSVPWATFRAIFPILAIIAWWARSSLRALLSCLLTC